MNIQRRLREEHEPEMISSFDENEACSVTSLIENHHEFIHNKTRDTKAENKMYDFIDQNRRRLDEKKASFEYQQGLSKKVSDEYHSNLAKLVNTYIRDFYDTHIPSIIQYYNIPKKIDNKLVLIINSVYRDIINAWGWSSYITKGQAELFDECICSEDWCKGFRYHIIYRFLKSLMYDILPNDEYREFRYKYYRDSTFEFGKTPADINRHSTIKRTKISHPKRYMIDMMHLGFNLYDNAYYRKQVEYFDNVKFAYADLQEATENNRKHILATRTKYLNAKSRCENYASQIAEIDKRINERMKDFPEYHKQYLDECYKYSCLGKWMTLVDPKCNDPREFVKRPDVQKRMYDAFRNYIYEQDPDVKPTVIGTTNFRITEINIRSMPDLSPNDRAIRVRDKIGPLIAAIESLSYLHIIYHWGGLKRSPAFLDDSMKISADIMKSYCSIFNFAINGVIDIDMYDKVSALRELCYNLMVATEDYIKNGTGFTIATVVAEYGYINLINKFATRIDPMGMDVRDQVHNVRQRPWNIEPLLKSYDRISIMDADIDRYKTSQKQITAENSSDKKFIAKNKPNSKSDLISKPMIDKYTKLIAAYNVYMGFINGQHGYMPEVQKLDKDDERILKEVKRIADTSLEKYAKSALSDTFKKMNSEREMM